jgi:hypothetical protein
LPQPRPTTLPSCTTDTTTFDVPLAVLSFNGLLYRDYEKARNLGFNLSFAATGGTTSNYGLPAGGANYNNFLTIWDANVAYQILPTIENDGPASP